MRSMLLPLLCVLSLWFCACRSGAQLQSLPQGSIGKEKELEQFITAHVAKIKPMSKAAGLAYWQASVTGKPEDYDKVSRLELAIRQVYSNRQEYAWLKSLKDSGRIADPKLQRQLVQLYNSYLSNQIDPDLMKRIVELSTRIQQRFHTYRGTIEGTTVTLNEINQILTTEKDSRKRELAWRASKQVGDVIAADLIQLVRLRNEGARKLGFDNFHTLSLTTGEQDRREIDRIFAELDARTGQPFAQVKAELDVALAKQYGVAVSELRPWHYHDPFFQRSPLVYGESLDQYYKDKDVKQVVERFYAGIGLPVDDILARSDLYERPGKDQHAFSTDIDREGDVRILANLKNDEYWTETALHELGHAVYSKYHDRNEPYLLRDAAHPFCTEAVAMFFGRLSRNADWMQQMLGLSDAQRARIETVSDKYMRLQQLIFARWAMVMYEFEKQLYANPDQDLNTLWWNLVEKYQLLTRPSGKPDAGWASKLHFTVAPCYYHNYMLGELLASQYHHHIVANVLRLPENARVSYVGKQEVGEFFRRNVFGPAAVYYWNDMIRRATGEPLTPKYFVAQFVR